MKAKLTWKALRGRGRFSIFTFRSRKRIQGFTLVELMIVIGLIVVLATVAIPAVLRSRVQSNETAAIGNLRTISSACESFRSTQNPPQYPASLTALVNSTPPYLDASWTEELHQGYLFSFVRAGDGETYSASATPRSPNVSGVNSYCVDQGAVIRRYTGGSGRYGAATGCDLFGTPV